MPKLTKDLLKKLIAEEVSRLSEGVEEDAVAELTKSSKDLINAMEKFQVFMGSSPLVKQAVAANFDNLLMTVREFFNNPKKFVKVEQPAVVKPKMKKKVVLKPAKKVV